jgi:hypothetical protein
MIKKLCEICFTNTAFTTKRSIPAMCNDCIELNWRVVNE